MSIYIFSYPKKENLGWVNKKATATIAIATQDYGSTIARYVVGYNIMHMLSDIILFPIHVPMHYFILLSLEFANTYPVRGGPFSQRGPQNIITLGPQGAPYFYDLGARSPDF